MFGRVAGSGEICVPRRMMGGRPGDGKEETGRGGLGYRRRPERACVG